MTKPAQLANAQAVNSQQSTVESQQRGRVAERLHLTLSPFENYYYSFMCYYLGIKKTPAPAALAKQDTHEADQSLFNRALHNRIEADS